MESRMYHIAYDDKVKQIKIDKDGWVVYLPVEMVVDFRNDLNAAIERAYYDKGRNEGVAVALKGTKHT